MSRDPDKIGTRSPRLGKSHATALVMVRLPPEVKKRWANHAKARKLTVSALLRRAVALYCGVPR